MDILQKHEIFEIEVLDRMKSGKMLDVLVFGGGSMLRLCHELNRYSVVLDFWFIKKTPHATYMNNLQKILAQAYEITDAEVKSHTILIEMRSRNYPKRLRIEIRKEINYCDFQERIAFSKFSTKQVILKTHTLEQMMKNKCAAFLDRNEIRDCFDIEFLLRKGIPLPKMSNKELIEFKKKVTLFSEKDFKVKLGSILEGDIRKYYIENRFGYLEEKLQ